MLCLGWLCLFYWLGQLRIQIRFVILLLFSLKTRERDMESVMETYLEEIYEIEKLLKEKQQLIEEIQSSKS